MFLIEKLYLLKEVNSTLEVANFLNRSIATVRYYKKTGLLNGSGPRNKYIFIKEDVENFVILRGL